ncbi:UDP-4-amino-4,6-dideoxy-N-acetyl-beta-L-altrosamine transaminase [Leptospira yasudae]|uniref:UDP-4-amino-4, 6-dideoxy-N-acetyl-beta-L-altrosamine transaminase n=1 Tax=Leptospira yasudae TaxID=2202201 RepID=UPI00109175C5|nr:UDP-4-amino-4,6-dideoxy-N-acetyl-beta-L-altrosamine transaminase [Leptospira yasudae]TGM95890.1 UDP-4-amino-4,6-dideoxy-N-acetyl-beta-L-altrosamine transaminase [Leptospira yasudae]
MNNIPYGKQHITEEDIDAVVQTLRSDFLTQGPKIWEFEEKFARYVGSKYAVAVSNGTAALHLSVLALGLKPGQKVITTPISFAATSNCVLFENAEIEFVDIDPHTALIDLKKLRALLEGSPKHTYSGIIPVDFAGCPVNLEEVREIADEFGLWIIEDACHAPGGFFMNGSGVKVLCGNGKYADASVFSFHPVKHIATGEGGMITTDSPLLYEKLILLRTHGITKDSERFLLSEKDVLQGGWYYEMQTLGYNYRISDILAALGISQLDRADVGIADRRRIASIYDDALSNKMNVQPLTKFSDFSGHAYHLYVIQTLNRNALYEKLRKNSVFTQVHYVPIHLFPYYKSLGYRKGMFPHAERYYEHALSLPMFPTLSKEDQDRVIQLLD